MSIEITGQTTFRGSGSGSGTVTSVALADSTGLFTITGSPIVGAGTLTLSAFASQAQATFLATPSGGAGAPAFRLIVASDIPTLNQNTTGSAATATTAGNLTGTPNISVGTIAASGVVSAQAGLTIGVANTTAGVLTLEGGTSGSATITAPAVAGTIANAIIFSNGISIPDATSFSINGDCFLSRVAAGSMRVGSVNNGSSGTLAAASFSSTGGQGCILSSSTMTKYNGDTTQGNGMASVVFSTRNAALTANFNAGAAKTVYTPAAGGVLRVSWSQSLVVVDGASSTVPSLTLGWTDVGGIARTQTLVATSTTNTTVVTSNGEAYIYCNATAVTITSAGYASGTPATMTYALTVEVERLAG